MVTSVFLVSFQIYLYLIISICHDEHSMNSLFDMNKIIFEILQQRNKKSSLICWILLKYWYCINTPKTDPINYIITLKSSLAVNPVLNIMGVNSLKVGGLHLSFNVQFGGSLRKINNLFDIVFMLHKLFYIARKIQDSES